MVTKGKKTKNPPILSHEFVIQNHADIVAVVAMVFIIGLMVQVLNPIASNFVLLQHNVTISGEGQDVTLYRSGPKDMLAVFFYTLILIIAHQVVQEFVLDKINKKLHLSKVKFSKFNESGQLAVFYISAFVYAANILYEENVIKNVSSLWLGYTDFHALMPWSTKLFFILQLSYWIHCFPELYFQKTKKEEMPARIQYASLYIVFILAGYILNFTRVMMVLITLQYLVEGLFHASRLLYFLEKSDIANFGFRAWSTLFVLSRLFTVSLSVLTFWFGLGKVNAESPSFGTSLPVRVGGLTAICLLQLWMTFNFITFYVRRRKEQEQLEAANKKLLQQNEKKANKKSKEESNGSIKKKN